MNKYSIARPASIRQSIIQKSKMYGKLFAVLLLGVFAFTARSWDYAAHQSINELALSSLPAEFT